jgi:hypothetical protein
MRTLNATALALLARIEAGEQIPVVQLVELVLDTPLYMTTAGRPIPWNSNTWTPAGIVVEPVDDAIGEFASINLVIPGVSSELLALALSEDVEGQTARIYDAIIDPDSGVVGDAMLAWSGTMTMPAIEDGPTATVSIACEHRGMLAMRPKISRYTDDEQRRLYAGDTSLDFDPATDAAPLAWPAASYWRQ